EAISMDRQFRMPGITGIVTAIMLVMLSCASLLPAQTDPMELQRRAIARIDSVVDFFRKTGDFRSRVGELSQAELELEASNRMLTARQDWVNLALGLIKQGHVYRMQSQWPQAIALYTQAEDAARRGQNVARQSEALAWRSMAERSQRNVGAALADATQ